MALRVAIRISAGIIRFVPRKPMSSTNLKTRPAWFVGAAYGSDDQTDRFLKKGIWENGYKNKYLTQVKSIQRGDRIAIKSAYTRKNDLPFDNRKQTVSVMAIKAIGTVTKNEGDGRHLRVNWQAVNPSKEWYFFTNRETIWRVDPDNWMRRALIEFAFDNKPQDYDAFRNAPYWAERFGEGEDKRFEWTKFYEAVADKLLAFRHDRSSLVAAVHSVVAKADGTSFLMDRFADGTSGPVKDICPFSVFAMFNRNLTIENRQRIAAGLAKFLGLTIPVPQSFNGIPTVNNQRSWFFAYDSRRKPGDIDALWGIFATALRFADKEDDGIRDEFATAFDDAMSRHGVKWNLTMGLYWARPWDLPTLDQQSRIYIKQTMGIPIPASSPKKTCTGEEYLSVTTELRDAIESGQASIQSFPELSFKAWSARTAGSEGSTSDNGPESDDRDVDEAVGEPYGVNEIVAEGCFVPLQRLNLMLERLKTKKNIVLQGPPGTGKTWLARRLGYALIGTRDQSKLRGVQFHPNLSYEDFVRGWRPGADGKLSLVDGPFLEVVDAAAKAPESQFVVIIEEINRGNPAQIFGEILTLMESEKRSAAHALELCHRKHGTERVHIPENLYVIGTMNIADRSLALVDLALRRRFAFFDLEPAVDERWVDWVHTNCGIDKASLNQIGHRVSELNSEIAGDPSLGPQYRVGHSFVTPAAGAKISNPMAWFKDVVETEIGPLLEEYWFDSRDKCDSAKSRLLANL